MIIDQGKKYPALLALSPDGRSLVTVPNRESEVQIWDPRDGQLRETIKLASPGNFRIQDVRFTPEGRHVAAAMGNGTVYILRIQEPPANVPLKSLDVAAAAKPKPPTRDLWKDLIGKPAPEFKGIKGWLFGDPVRMSDLRGKYVIVCFWGVYGEQDMSALMKLHQELGDHLEIVVVETVYEDAVEKYQTIYASRSKEWWGGRKLPFRVALDSSEQVLIAGTGVKTRGSTHAAFRIQYSSRGRLVRSTCLLIDREGTVLRQLSSRPRSRTVAPVMGIAPNVPEWHTRITQQYALKAGQMLKRNAPPYLPERADFVFYNHGRGDAVMGFRHGDTVRWNWMTSRKSLDLRDVLNRIAKLKSFEIEGEQELLKLQVAGDWTVREGATPQSLVSAVEQIVRSELGKPVRIGQEEVERDVIVVSGEYEFKQLPNTPKDAARIYFCVEDLPDPTFGGGGSGDFAKMLNQLGDRLQWPIINEVESPPVGTLRWGDRLASHQSKIHERSDEGKEKLERILANLTKQTNLMFKHERRKIKVWRVFREKR